MPIEKFATAASAVAASATSNVMAGRTTQMKPYDRKLLAISVIETDNTPVIGELTVVVKNGDTEVGRTRSILTRTTAGEFAYPDDFDVIDALINGGLNISIDVINGDGAAAHGALLALLWDHL